MCSPAFFAPSHSRAQRRGRRVLLLGRSPRHALPAAGAGQSESGYSPCGFAASPLADFRQADDCLARIRLKYPGDEENPIPFHQAVQRYQAEQDDDLARRLRTFLQQVADWRNQANKRPVAELLWTIYEQSGYLTYCAGLADGQQRVANLIYLHERAAQFGTFLRQDLHRFLQFLENIREERDLGRPSTATGGEQAVRIMTIHRAKGLEFPVVIIPDLGKMHNLSDSRGAILLDRKRGLGMDVVDERRMIRYPSLASTLVAESLLRQSLAEELRLLYVAMTPAREHLILMATCSDKSIEQWNQQWQNRPGPMSADRFLAARNALDWLGAAAALTASAKPPVFEITRHTVDDVRQWPVKHYAQDATSPLQETMAALEPLTPPLPTSALAESVKQRFQVVYPFKAFSNRTASASVTALSKSAADPMAAQSKTNSPTARKLDLPTFFCSSTAQGDGHRNRHASGSTALGIFQASGRSGDPSANSEPAGPESHDPRAGPDDQSRRDRLVPDTMWGNYWRQITKH